MNKFQNSAGYIIKELAKYILCIILVLSSKMLYSQCYTCLEAEIDGIECTGCAPDGWSLHSESPDMINSDMPWLGCELDSVFDGNIMALAGVFPAVHFEGNSTLLTGLVPGETYLIGFKTYTCSTSPSQLVFTLDDENYIFSNIIDTGYEEIFICFTASKSEVELIIQVEVTELGIVWYYVDSLPCTYLESQNTNCSPPQVTPEFPDFSFCNSESLTVMPLVSDNGYTGVWDGPDNFSQFHNEYVTLSFNIDPGQNNCLDVFTYEVFIYSDELPSFSFPLTYCSGDLSDFFFPLESDNSIVGNWDFNLLTPAAIGAGTVMNTFYPDAVLYPCINPVLVEIEILPGELLSFDIPRTFCYNENYTFPTISNNNITGQWLYPELGLLDTIGTIQNFFTVDAAYCDSFYVHTFTILQAIVDTISSPPSMCGLEDGLIQLNSFDNLEYSIDGGASWQPDGLFADLSFGTHQIIYRYVSFDTCIDTLEFFLSGKELPTIDSLNIVDDIDCTNTIGQVEIYENSQSSLEFSLDGGQNWTDNNLFENLESGTYNLLVRYLADTSCIDSVAFEIAEVTMPIIENIVVGDVSNCNLQDGSIEIEANGTDLEYSINGGLTWYNNPSFTNLSSGTYFIEVQSVMGLNCIDTILQIIAGPEALPEVNLQLTQPSNCEIEDGSINIVAPITSPLLEFSLDEGVTWQDSTLYELLASGDYTLLYRFRDNAACDSLISFSLTAPLLPIIEDVIIVQDTSCINNTGAIEIISQDQNLEFSINGNVEWQVSNQFENLDEGIYSISMRNAEFFNCVTTTQVEIISPDPLEFLLQTFPADCMDSNSGSVQIIETTGGNGEYSYSIDGTNYVEQSGFTNLSPLEYMAFVIDETDCTEIEEFVIGIKEDIGIILPQVLIVEEGETIILNPLINETSIDSFSWTGAYIINEGELVAEVMPAQTTEYTLSVYYGEDCLELRTITVEVISEQNIYIANIINSSPNNETIYVQGDDSFTGSLDNFTIYDRWGNQVFSKSALRINNPYDGWNGYDYGSGVYIYVLEYTINNETKFKTGNFTLIK